MAEADGLHVGARFPHNDHERTAFLQSLQILDSPAEEAFDDITQMLTEVFNTPIALVSLVDSHRQWFKSKTGLDAAETPREQSFCAHLLLPDQPSILLIPDATKDKRFDKNPLVTGPPYIKFYCGAPILLHGMRLGSLCIIDRIPREDMDRSSAMLLGNFADLVARMIEKSSIQSKQHHMLDNPSLLVEYFPSDKDWRIIYTNKAAKALVDGVEGKDGFEKGSFNRIIQLVGQDASENEANKSALNWSTPHVRKGVLRKSEEEVLCYFHPAARQVLARSGGEQIIFPYTEPNKEDANIPQVVTDRRYAFVMLKGHERDGDEESNERSQGPFASTSKRSNESKETPGLDSMDSAIAFSKVVNLIGTMKELQDAMQSGLCAILFTSSFCSSCTQYAEFYEMQASLAQDMGVLFCKLDVDDSMEVASSLNGPGMFLPSVNFYKQGVLVDSIAGELFANLPEKLDDLLVAAEISEEMSESAPCKLVEKAINGAMDVHEVPTRPPSDTSRLSEERSLSHANLWSRLDAERTYSRSLEALLHSTRKRSDAVKAGELEAQERNVAAAKAKLELLQAQRKSVRLIARANVTAGIQPIFEISAEELASLHNQGMRPREAPPYRFSGTVRSTLMTGVANAKVLIYGNNRADMLEGDMVKLGIDASRQVAVLPIAAIPTHGRLGRCLAIIDVPDPRTPEEARALFKHISDALPPGGVFATISTDLDYLEVLGMLGDYHGWTIAVTFGSKKDYSVLSLTKGHDSDHLLRQKCHTD